MHDFKYFTFSSWIVVIMFFHHVLHTFQEMLTIFLCILLYKKWTFGWWTMAINLWYLEYFTIVTLLNLLNILLIFLRFLIIQTICLIVYTLSFTTWISIRNRSSLLTFYTILSWKRLRANIVCVRNRCLICRLFLAIRITCLCFFSLRLKVNIYFSI